MDKIEMKQLIGALLNVYPETQVTATLVRAAVRSSKNSIALFSHIGDILLPLIDEPTPPFNLIEHLKAGGKLIDRWGNVVEYVESCVRRIDGNNEDIHISDMMLDDYDWQPYTEPKREAGWYSVQIMTNGELAVDHFNGKRWGNEVNHPHEWNDETYEWIGKTRIELEQPETTKD